MEPDLFHLDGAFLAICANAKSGGEFTKNGGKSVDSNRALDDYTCGLEDGA
jgi:hypothetical protein